jgi:D-lyxose ketol-isomerase
MRRSDINLAYRDASECFRKYSWALPPGPKWDITDFGLGDFRRCGLTLVNLAGEPEYCEKLMYQWKGQIAPCHTHARKKEDIICRVGRLALRLWASKPESEEGDFSGETEVPVDGVRCRVATGRPFTLEAGQRVTLLPGIWHAFAPASDECIIGEVSTANDDLRDNFFLNPEIGRFPGIVEDEPAKVRLVSE